MSKKSYAVLLLGTLLFATHLVEAQLPLTAPSAPQVQPLAYPHGWDVQVKEKTKLEGIKQVYERRPMRMLATDLEDRSPLPAWFRAYLRDNLPGIPISGKYQYPRVAQEILEWMLAHPDLEPVAGPTVGKRQISKAAATGTNINLTSFDERNSESCIAQDYNHPQYLIAASNNIKKSGHQRQFYSSDGGASWRKTELPFAPGTAIHSDPALAFSSDGTAWAATLGIDSLGTQIQVQVFKSVDHGATWSYVSTASTGRNNDKELMWIDTSPTSPFKDSIYLAWDVPGQGMRFTRSINGGVSWSPETILSTEPAIGAHLTTGPAGEIYVTWPATDASQILMAKSADGGASFQPPKLIATTTASYEMSVPAMCQRQALIYTAIGVDRSAGPRRGAIYVAWTDLDATDGEPGCAGISSPVHSRVFISSSSDGGTTWNTPHQVRTGSSVVVGDQFNQWIDVDQGNGNLHVMFYDTRDDPNRRKTNVYYLASKDGGLTWGDEVKVSSEQTDETAAGADGGNQYGDYNGIVAFRDVAFPSWTDRRLSSAITKEQIFTASIVRSDGEPSDSSKALVAETLNIGLSQPERLKAYPKEWEVQVPQGTLLDILSKHLAAEAVILPARDLEDRSPLPVWFRVYLRKRFPHLSTSGRYQYPRTAQSILQHLLTQPNSLGP